MTKPTRGESGNGGESEYCPRCGIHLDDPGHVVRANGCSSTWSSMPARIDRERHVLAQRLEAVGHGMCACDLEAADWRLVTEVARGIVDHLEAYCGAPREQDQPIARDLQAWASRYEAELAS